MHVIPTLHITVNRMSEFIPKSTVKSRRVHRPADEYAPMLASLPMNACNALPPVSLRPLYAAVVIISTLPAP